MATMPTTWPTTPWPQACCSGGTRCPARPCRRNLRSRGSRTARAAPRSYRMGREWWRRRRSSSGIGELPCTVRARSRHPSIWSPTADLTHGAQQLTFFNGHYGGWCYLPLLGFLSVDREAEQYLCAAVLRPGQRSGRRRDPRKPLCRLLPLLRAAFPRARFLVQLDGGFATPEVFDFLDAEPRLDYRGGDGERMRFWSGMPNPRCRSRARRARSVARPHTSIPTPATPPAPGPMSAGW